MPFPEILPAKWLEFDFLRWHVQQSVPHQADGFCGTENIDSKGTSGTNGWCTTWLLQSSPFSWGFTNWDHDSYPKNSSMIHLPVAPFVLVQSQSIGLPNGRSRAVHAAGWCNSTGLTGWTGWTNSFSGILATSYYLMGFFYYLIWDDYLKYT